MLGFAASVLAVSLLVPATGAGRPEREPRIVGGGPAPPGAYPWVAALVFRDEPAEEGQFCGGSLIKPKVVVTAGHCVEGTSPREFEVVVGRYDLRLRDGQRIRVEKVGTNPNFYPVGFTLRNDVAQVRLKEKAIPAPIGLVRPADRELTVAGTPALALGWGLIREGGPESPTELYQVDLKIVSDADCKDAYGAYAPPTIICAGARGKDTCQGDSGGPLIVSDGLGGWLLAGVVSSGKGCARPNFPGLYARVSGLNGFILEPDPVFAPFNKDRPAIVGDSRVGGTLKCRKGKWHGDVSIYNYLWTLVRNAEPTQAIWDGQFLPVVKHFQGKRVTCFAFAANRGGFAGARSTSVRLRQRG